MKQPQRKLRVIFMTIAIVLCSLTLNPTATLAHSAAKQTPQSGRPMQAGNSASKGVGKATTLAVTTIRMVTDKLTGKISSHIVKHAFAAAPAYAYLNTSYADWILEPPASGKDFYGNSYTDWDFAYFCGPGAAAVSLDYWATLNTRAIGIHNYYTPIAGVSTWWGDSNPGGFRDTSYMMYLATQVQPPTYATPGMMYWPTRDTAVQDLADALNWESSNHGALSSNWRSYFYLMQHYYYDSTTGQPSLPLSTLRSAVTTDIYNNGIPPIALVNDAYLPDWANAPNKGHGHYVAIIGYNNSAGTFTYEETCGPYSCGTSSFGQHTISQQQMYNAIINYGGYLVW